MRPFKIISFLSLAITAICADYNTVRQDLASILDLLAELDNSNAAVFGGPASIPFALQVQVDAVAIHKKLLTATDNANASPPFGIGSLAVSADFIGAQPKISAVLDNLRGKRNDYGDLGVIVLYSLYQMRQDTERYSSTIIEKLGTLEQAIAPAIVQMILDSFDKAIAAYKD